MSKHKRLKNAAQGEALEDTSPIVSQNSKISFPLTLSPLKWTEKQQLVIDTILSKDTKVVFIKSCAGTGKTAMSLFAGLQLLKEKKVSNIYYLRNPVESSSKGIGFLKGTEDEKLQPFLMPLIDNIGNFLPKGEYNRLIAEKYIDILPLGFLKGRTFNANYLICDEAEDLLLRPDLTLVLSRLGKFSKLLIIGDTKQSNVKGNGFDSAFKIFDNQESKDNGIHCFKFGIEDIMRNDVIGYIIQTIEKYESGTDYTPSGK